MDYRSSSSRESRVRVRVRVGVLASVVTAAALRKSLGIFLRLELKNIFIFLV